MTSDNIYDILTTSDGSHTIYHKGLDETYHSRHGAWQESVHVFIKNGLDFKLSFNLNKKINILEVGFGTGLNALLTLQMAYRADCLISYTTLEAFPLKEEIWSHLNYDDTNPESRSLYEKIHLLPWGEQHLVTPNFRLLKVHSTIQEINLSELSYDLIYFDAFAPSKQPEMWEPVVLKKIVDAMSCNGIFVTYCAKGQLKRDLKNLLLQVETLEGPPGKKEMVRAIKNC